MSESNVVFYGGDGRTVATFALSAGTSYSCDVPRWAQRMVLYVAEPPPLSPVPTREDAPEFKAHVLRWLQEEYIPQQGAAEVLAVSGWGTDWEGGTYEGFYPDNGVTVVWRDTAGKEHHREVKGDDFVGLWHWVVSSWPAPESAEVPSER